MHDRVRAGAATAAEAISRGADTLGPLVGRAAPRATLFHQLTPATRYWRITLPSRHLPGKVLPAHELRVRHFIKKQKLTFPQLRGDTAIVQYPGDEGSALVAMAMEAEGKRLFVEADDNYVDFGDELWMKRAGWGSKIGENSYSVQGHRWIVEHSHGVIVTTRLLAEAYGQLNDNVHVCRNSIDPSDWPRWVRSLRDRETFRIGWYAGGSHDRDATMISKALSWASRQPNVEIVNIGLNPGWGFKRTQVEWTNDVLGQRKELQRLDVGVSPLVQSPLAMYRSDVKALEYAMAGAMPLLQSAEPYWEWEDKEYARVAHTPGDWMSQIKWAVANRDEVRARARWAREYVLRERTIDKEINRWHDAIRGGEA